MYKGLRDGTGCITVSEAPTLVVAGDGCMSSSGFGSCLASAAAAKDAIVSHL